MGRIHDALERAERERAARDGDPYGFAQTLGDGGLRATRSAATPAADESLLVAELTSDVNDEYRSLRARIQSLRRARPLRSLVVTSACAGDGKTTTAVNLAMSCGLERELDTCLVEADLRTPRIHALLSERPPVGLTEVLEGDARLEHALVRVPSTRLAVLGVRSVPTQPAELLASSRMRTLLEELEKRFALVIVDAPPVLGLPDALQLVDLCDAVLLVVAAGATRRAELEAALQRIDPGKLIGAVLNRAARPA
jgi:polysaccharide biosynthesis transport protein